MTNTAPTTTAAAGGSAEVPLLERVLFFVLLSVLCARPLIPESFQRVELSFLSTLGADQGTTPAATAWLDSLTLTAAIAALLRRREPLTRGRWVVWGAVLLTAGVAVSLLAAGDKRLALNVGFSLVISVLAGMALASLMRSPWMPRLLLAAMLATGGASAAKCFMQKAYEFDDTLAYWNENKDKLAPAGIDPDDPLVVNFERRLQSGEATAYQPHPNLAASLLMMWLLATGGALAGAIAGWTGAVRGERGVVAILAAGLCAALAGALWFTGSLGGLAAGGAGIATLIALGFWRRRIAARAGYATGLAVAAYVVLIAAGVGHGIYHGTLPSASLAFRWQYWTAAEKAYCDAPLTGLGRGNFLDAYLLHKSPEGTEDVRDPHNLWVSLLVELGPLGLAGGVMLVIACAAAALRRLDAAPPGPPQPHRIELSSLVVAGVGVLLLQALFSGMAFTAALALLWAVGLAGVWVISLAAARYIINRLPASPPAQGWVVAGLAAAMGAVVLHALVDFALLTPAGLSTFVVLAACAASWWPQPRGGSRPSTTVPIAVAGAALLAAHILLVTVPTMRGEFWLNRMRQARFAPGDVRACRSILQLGQAALDADPLDPDTARQVAQVAAWMGTNIELSASARLDLLERAEGFAHVALARNPHSSTAHAGLAKICEQIAENAALERPDAATAALQRAAQQWQAAVVLAPTDPRRRIAAGKAWFAWWEESDDLEAARKAAGHFAAALHIDATRKPEEVMRLRPGELSVLYEDLRTLERAGFGVPTASAPATAPAP